MTTHGAFQSSGARTAPLEFAHEWKMLDDEFEKLNRNISALVKTAVRRRPATGSALGDPASGGGPGKRSPASVHDAAPSARDVVRDVLASPRSEPPCPTRPKFGERQLSIVQ